MLLKASNYDIKMHSFQFSISNKPKSVCYAAVFVDRDQHAKNYELFRVAMRGGFM